MVNSPVS